MTETNNEAVNEALAMLGAVLQGNYSGQVKMGLPKIEDLITSQQVTLTIDRFDLACAMQAEEEYRLRQARALRAFCIALEIVGKKQDRRVAKDELVTKLGSTASFCLSAAEHWHLLTPTTGAVPTYTVSTLETLSPSHFGANLNTPQYREKKRGSDKEWLTTW